MREETKKTAVKETNQELIMSLKKKLSNSEVRALIDAFHTVNNPSDYFPVLVGMSFFTPFPNTAGQLTAGNRTYYFLCK